LRGSHSRNQLPKDVDTSIITNKFEEELQLQRMQYSSQPTSTTVSPLGIVSKSDGGWRRTHNLSWPEGRSINDAIPAEYGTLVYSTIDEVCANILAIGQGAIVMKRDIKDAFRNIPVCLAHRRLLGFAWNGVVYEENCLSFGLRTAPLLFNLFAEALHWILEYQLAGERVLILHYLDDFIFVLPPGPVTIRLATAFDTITDDLGVPRKESKNTCGQVSDVLGYLVDTKSLTLSLPQEKVQKLRSLIEAFTRNRKATLLEYQELGGNLVWAAKVVLLGRSYTRSIWDFERKFKDLSR
jgi:hypothetical protein